MLDLELNAIYNYKAFELHTYMNCSFHFSYVLNYSLSFVGFILYFCTIYIWAMYKRLGYLG